MKRVILLTMLALPATLALAADPTPLNLNPGEWEYTVTMRMTGMPQMSATQIPEEQLAKLAPEQRAKMEAALKQAADMTAGKPTVSKNCLKKDDLARLDPMSQASPNCNSQIVEASAAKRVLKTSCDTADNQTTSEITIEAVSPTQSRFRAVTSGMTSGHAMNMTVEGSSEWLAAECSEQK